MTTNRTARVHKGAKAPLGADYYCGATGQFQDSNPEPNLGLGPQVTELFDKLGAGEANRTPDPNLGKVMLYP